MIEGLTRCLWEADLSRNVQELTMDVSIGVV